VGYVPDLKNPKSFNEKLQWLKLHWRDPKATQCADKYSVRHYVIEQGYGDILNNLLGVYDNVDDINFDSLPNKFVLKATHGSGMNIICKDKSKLDINNAKKMMMKWLKQNYYYHSFEWVYKDIRPRIVCEEFLEDSEYKDLIDYKFMCFNGEIRCLFICSDRDNIAGLKVDFYDMDWKLMPFYRYYPNSGNKIEKPEGFDRMIEYAKILSRPFPFVRVDFYQVNGKIFFGELTFFPGSGMEYFKPELYDYRFGDWIKLPDVNN